MSNETDPRNEKPTDAEIVRVLAERVMGWEIISFTQWVKRTRRPDYDLSGMCVEHDDGTFTAPTDHKGNCQNYFRPTESWADAGMLLDRLRAMGKVFILKADGLRDGTHNPGYTALCDNMPRCDAESGPRAISLAAYEWAMSQEKQNAD